MSQPHGREIRIWLMRSFLLMFYLRPDDVTRVSDGFGQNNTAVDICLPHNCCVSATLRSTSVFLVFFGYLEIWFRVLLALLPLLTSSSIHTASYKHLSGCARSSWKTQIQLFLFWAAALCRCASTYHCSRSEPMEREARRAPFAPLYSSSCQYKKLLVILPLISIQSATDMLPATPSYIILEQKTIP